MQEQTYRQSPKPQHKTCPSCGTPVLPDRMVYAASGELVCAGCEVSSDSTDKLRRGAKTTAYAAAALGGLGTNAALFLVLLLLDASDWIGSRGSARASGGMMAFLGVIVALGVGSILGSFRTLASPAVLTALEGKTGGLKALSLSGIVLGPLLLVMWLKVVTLH